MDKLPDKIKGKFIEKEAYSFSGQQVHDFCDGACDIITYTDLAKYDDIYNAFNGKDALVILFLTSKNFGHWVTLIDHGNHHLEFFDSYAMEPDAQLKFVPKNFRKVSNQDYPHLTWLLLNSGAKIQYNDTPLQIYNKDAGREVSTCGRHVSCRVFFRRVPLKKYVKIMTKYKKRGITPDMIVSYLTGQY